MTEEANDFNPFDLMQIVVNGALDLATSFATIPFTMRANGAPMAFGGVTAVGTLPEYRRRSRPSRSRPAPARKSR